MAEPPVSDTDFLTTLRNSRFLARTPAQLESFAQTGEYSILGLPRAANQAAIRERLPERTTPA